MQNCTRPPPHPRTPDKVPTDLSRAEYLREIARNDPSKVHVSVGNGQVSGLPVANRARVRPRALRPAWSVQCIIAAARARYDEWGVLIPMSEGGGAGRL